MSHWGIKWFNDWIGGLGRLTLLARDAICSLFTFKISPQDVLYQLYFAGVKSQTVVLITGAFTGMVLVAQTYFQFHKVRMDTATLPVLTGLMVAGRVGAAIAAELGSMRVTEQIDALRTLATHPVDYLVVPRFVALTAALPLLTVEAIAIGIGSSYIMGVYLLGIDPVFSWHTMLKYTHAHDLSIGLIKATIFGAVVALVACYKGMSCGDGAEGVGRATTEAVVFSSITILVTNLFLTLAFGKIFHRL